MTTTIKRSAKKFHEAAVEHGWTVTVSSDQWSLTLTAERTDRDELDALCDKELGAQAKDYRIRDFKQQNNPSSLVGTFALDAGAFISACSNHETNSYPFRYDSISDALAALAAPTGLKARAAKRDADATRSLLRGQRMEKLAEDYTGSKEYDENQYYRKQLVAAAATVERTVTVSTDVRRAMRAVEDAMRAMLLSKLAAKVLRYEGCPSMWEDDVPSMPFSLQAAAQRVMAESVGDWDVQGVEAHQLNAMNELRRMTGLY